MSASSRNVVMAHYCPNRLTPLSDKKQEELGELLARLSCMRFATYTSMRLVDESLLYQNEILSVAFLTAVISKRGGLDANGGDFQKGWLGQVAEQFAGSLAAQLPHQGVTISYVTDLINNFFNALGSYQAQRQRRWRRGVATRKQDAADRVVADEEEAQRMRHAQESRDQTELRRLEEVQEERRRYDEKRDDDKAAAAAERDERREERREERKAAVEERQALHGLVASSTSMVADILARTQLATQPVYGALPHPQHTQPGMARGHPQNYLRK